MLTVTIQIDSPQLEQVIEDWMVEAVPGTPRTAPAVQAALRSQTRKLLFAKLRDRLERTLREDALAQVADQLKNLETRLS